MTKFAKPDPEGKDSVIEPDDQVYPPYVSGKVTGRS